MSLSAGRLRRITRHRERLERLQELKLAAARQASAAREHALQAAEQELDGALRAGGTGVGPLDPAVLAAASAHLVRTGKAIAARQAALRHSRVVEEQQLEALLARRRDRKATETLLDARIEEERERGEQAEARRIDESATRGWQRRRTATAIQPEGGGQ